MALLSFRGISTPSLKAQGEQRRSSLFNIPRDNPVVTREALYSPHWRDPPSLPSPTTARRKDGRSSERPLEGRRTPPIWLTRATSASFPKFESYQAASSSL